MRRLPLLLLPFLLCSPLRAQGDDAFTRNYWSIYEGYTQAEAAEEAGNFRSALDGYEGSLQNIEALLSEHPDHTQAPVLARRRNILREAIERVRPLAAATPGQSEPTRSFSNPRGDRDPGMEQLRGEIERLHAERDDLRSRMKENQERFARATEEARLQAAELRAEGARLRDQLREARDSSGGEAAALQEEIAELRTQLDAANGRLEEATHRNAELLAEVQAAQQRIEELEASEARLTEERQQLIDRAAMASSEAGLNKLVEENTRLQEQFGELQRRYDELHAKNEADQAEAANLKLQVADLQQQVESLRSENDSYKRQLDEMRADLDSTRDQLAAATDDVDTSVAENENRLLRQQLVRQMHQQQRRERMRDLLLEQLAQVNANSEDIIKSLDDMVTDPHESQRDREIAEMLEIETGGFVVDAEGSVSSETAGQVANRLEGMDDLARTAQEDFAAGRFERALHSMDIMLDIVPNDVPTLVNRGVVLLRLGRATEAEDDFKKALAQRDDNSFARTMLGLSFLEQDNVERAVEELELATEFNPKDSQAHFYRGLVAQRQNDFATAEAEYQLAVDLNPNYADAHFNLGALLSQEEPMDQGRARQHYENALRLGAARDLMVENRLGKL